MIEGKVIVKEDENVIRVEGETNLIEDTTIDVNLTRAYGELGGIIGKVGGESGKVKSDGTFFIDYEVEDDFFETYNGEHIEVTIEVEHVEYLHNNIKKDSAQE